MHVYNKQHVFYAGIGSRQTPLYVQDRMVSIARRLAAAGAVLRSGHAPGADMAFERGCDQCNGPKEIYLPWKGFNKSLSSLYNIDPGAIELARKFHPNWSKLTQGAKLLQARNSYQVLGLDLNTPVKFVICYTTDGGFTGGTGQAMRIADHYDIPIINLRNDSDPVQTILKILV